MKYLFLFLILLLTVYIVSLQFKIDGLSYPFGSRLDTTRMIEGVDEVRGQMHEIDLPNYAGYKVGNNIREVLLIIGCGVGLAGAVGWIAIRKAENRLSKR